MPRREARVLVTCEHGGNRIPPRWAALFGRQRKLLESHRGWDPGALTLARALAKALDAPLIASTTSRLLVDLNRSEHHRALFSPITRALPDAERERILDEVYRPYRGRVEQFVDGAVARGRVLHLSAHSFVPVLAGEKRRTDVGLLYDPARRPEKAFCDAWFAALDAELPGFAVRRNSPYRGTADGLTTALRRRHAANDYIGVEIELNQRLLESGGFETVARALSATLRRLI